MNKQGGDIKGESNPRLNKSRTNSDEPIVPTKQLIHTTELSDPPPASRINLMAYRTCHSYRNLSPEPLEPENEFTFRNYNLMEFVKAIIVADRATQATKKIT